MPSNSPVSTGRAPRSTRSARTRSNWELRRLSKLHSSSGELIAFTVKSGCLRSHFLMSVPEITYVPGRTVAETSCIIWFSRADPATGRRVVLTLSAFGLRPVSNIWLRSRLTLQSASKLARASDRNGWKVHLRQAGLL